MNTHTGTAPPHAAPPPEEPKAKPKDVPIGPPQPDDVVGPPCPTCGQPLPPRDKMAGYQEYPKMMYKAASLEKKEELEVKAVPEPETKIVNNKDEEAQATSEGYSEMPPPPTKEAADKEAAKDKQLGEAKHPAGTTEHKK